MKQLQLELLPAPPATLDDFAGDSNAELLHALQYLPAGQSLYIWGEPGSGRSRLLRAFCENYPNAKIFNASEMDKLDYNFLDQIALDLIAIDDVDELNSAGQVMLFNLFNRMREISGQLKAIELATITEPRHLPPRPGIRLVLTGKIAPAQLQLREDLRTRLAWGLIFQLKPLTDEEKIKLLSRLMLARGVILQPEVLEYMMTRCSRDIRYLTRLIEALDHYSIEQQKPFTMNLLRTFLNTHEISLSGSMTP